MKRSLWFVFAPAAIAGACGSEAGGPELGALPDGGSSSSGSSGSSGASSGTSGSPGPRGPRRDPIDPSTKCYFTGDIATERISDVIRASGCGVGTVTDGIVLFRIGELDLLEGRNLQIEFDVEGTLRPGRVGPLLVERTRLTLSEGQTKYVWESRTCSLEVVTNTATDRDGGPFDDADLDAGAFDMKVIGKGTCADPLQPKEGATQVASVTPFEFMIQATRR